MQTVFEIVATPFPHCDFEQSSNCMHWQIFVGHKPKNIGHEIKNIGHYKTHACFSIHPVYQCNV